MKIDLMNQKTKYYFATSVTMSALILAYFFPSVLIFILLASLTMNLKWFTGQKQMALVNSIDVPEKVAFLARSQEELQLPECSVPPSQVDPTVLHKEFCKVGQWFQQRSRDNMACPTSFALRPNESKGWRWSLPRDEVRMVLYCQEPGHWHPVAGEYQLCGAQQKLNELAPHFPSLSKVLKQGSTFEDGNLLAQLQDLIFSDEDRAFYDSDDELFQLEPCLFALRALLLELDPQRQWGGLKQMETEDGLLWLCPEHAAAHRKEKAIKNLGESTTFELELHLGIGILWVVDEMVERIIELRQQFAQTTGFLLPRVRICDNLSLGPDEYSLKISGAEVVRYQLHPSLCLALVEGVLAYELEGIPAVDPIYGLEGIWIEAYQVDAAREAGYTVVSPTGLMITHLKKLADTNVARLFNYERYRETLNSFDSPYLIEELVSRVPHTSIHQILRALLEQGHDISHLRLILETLLVSSVKTQDIELLEFYVADALSTKKVKTMVS